MAYQGVSDGLYLASRQTRKLGFVKHHALVDIGNVLRNTRFDSNYPIIYHQTTEGLRAEWMGVEMWTVDIGNPIVDVDGARERVIQAQNNPKYDLFKNNCEHFTSFVANGKRQSGQLQVVGTIAAIGAFFVVAANSDQKTTKNSKSFF